MRFLLLLAFTVSALAQNMTVQVPNINVATNLSLAAATGSRLMMLSAAKGATNVASTGLVDGTGTAADASDVTGALGFTPVNKAGDTITGAVVITNSANTKLLSVNAPFAQTNDILRANSGTAAAWNVPLLTDIPGYTRPIMVLASDATNIHKHVVLAGAGGDYAMSLDFLGSGGTLANPTESWTGGMGAINGVGYVGGSVNDWRVFTVMEFGNIGGNPTSASEVKGKFQIASVNGTAGRPGFVVYNDCAMLTDFLPLRLMRTGHSNTYDGFTTSYSQAAARFIGTNFVFGTEYGVDSVIVLPVQIEVGNALISQHDYDGFTLGATRSLLWSSATGSVGTVFPAYQLALTNVAAGVLGIHDGATSAGIRVFNTHSSGDYAGIDWSGNNARFGTAGPGSRAWRLRQANVDVAIVNGANFGLELRSDMSYAWHSDTSFSGVDTAMSRVSAGVTKTIGSGAVIGSHLSKQFVVAKTADYSVVENDSSKVITNEGTTAKRNNTLPGAAAGLTYTFIVQDSDGLTVTAAAGDTIRIAASVTGAAGNIDSTTVGNTVTLVAVNATEWIATSVMGTWTVSP